MQAKTTTQIIQQTEHPTQEQSTSQPTLILRLQHKPVPRVSWTQDTIDNEHMNKKKSNLCCIYHRPGESSSDTCTSDDEGNALERDRHTKHLHKQKCSKRKNNNKQQQVKKQDSCCKGPGHKHEKKFADEQ